MIKTIGKIANYKAGSGLIIDSNGIQYIVTKQNIMYPNPKNGDLVSFNIEKFKTVEIDVNLATFVKKYEGTKLSSNNE